MQKLAKNTYREYYENSDPGRNLVAVHIDRWKPQTADAQVDGRTLEGQGAQKGPVVEATVKTPAETPDGQQPGSIRFDPDFGGNDCRHVDRIHEGFSKEYSGGL